MQIMVVSYVASWGHDTSYMQVGALDTWQVHEKSFPCAKQTNSSWFLMLDQLLARKWKILEF